MKYETSDWLRSTSTCTVSASTADKVTVPNSVPLGPHELVQPSTSKSNMRSACAQGAKARSAIDEANASVRRTDFTMARIGGSQRGGRAIDSTSHAENKIF